MKIFEVIEFGCYEFSSNVQTELFSTKERALVEWRRRVENAKMDAMNFLADDEREIEEDEDKLWFDVYKSGEASQWECNIWVNEKELDEE